MGFASTYVAVSTGIGSLIGSSLLTYISVTLSYSIIFVGIGCIQIIVALAMVFGIRDVTKDKKFQQDMNELMAAKRTLKKIELREKETLHRKLSKQKSD